MRNIEEIRNSIRNNARSPREFHGLITKAVYELFGLIVKIPIMIDDPFLLSTIDNYHYCPIDGVTNWGNHDKTKPVSYVGWQLNNIHGTIRDVHGNIPSDEFINNIDKDIIKDLKKGGFSLGGDFNVINMFSYLGGINIGTFGGSYDFKGCFRIFLDDFPHIVNNLDFLYSASDIKRHLGISDYKAHLRRIKVKMIQNKIKTKQHG